MLVAQPRTALAAAFALTLSLLVAGCGNRGTPVRTEPAASAPATAASAAPQAPVAARHPYGVPSPFGARNDDYYWLRDDTRTKPEVLDYLKAENAYTDAVLAHTKPAQDLLYDEIVARIKQDDATVPQYKSGYWYYTRYEQGKEYPVYARRADQSTPACAAKVKPAKPKPPCARDYSADAPEEVLVDGNARAEGHDFFQVASWEVSPDNRQLAWTEDTVGRRQWVLHFKDLASGKESAQTIPNVDPGIAWANDSRTVLYVEKDPVTLLGFKVHRHALGADPKRDPVLYEEKDHAFYMGVGRSESDRYVYIYLQSTVATEQWVADASDPKLAFKVLVPRERDHLYQATDLGDRYVIRTNWQAKNYRVVEVPKAKVADRKAWKDVIPARPDAFVDDVFAFKSDLAVAERSGGLRNIRIHHWADGKERVIAADEATYSARLGDNRDPESTRLRYNYASLTTPNTVYDFDLATGERTLRKRDPVLGKFDPADYQSEFVWVPARDGVKVPVSLVYRKGYKRDGTAPLLQLGYGSYGISSDPNFVSSYLSLLERGFVVAIAHVRGGQEMGRQWYDDGHLLAKKNTFNDFVDVTRWLGMNKYAAKDKIFARGGSAGGLLMGAIVNQCPDCYRGVLALVPFVDVVTTMLDTSIPLTSNEFDEWGNPTKKEYYDYMLSYSPYDNVERKAYPAMLVSTGLWDSQVQYFEPAKWVAKLRAYNTGKEPLLFHVNMEAGHGGKSGRFQAYHETAMYYAFLFDRLGRDLAKEAKGATAAAH